MSSIISIGIGIPFGRRGGGFTAEYKAILDRATALNYTLPSAGVQVKQNNLLKALIAAGIWAKLDVFYCYAQDGSAEFATINWKEPLLYQNTLINSPTFTSNQGFTGNNTSSYINTNYGPTGLDNYKQNDASRYVYIRALVPNRVIDGNETNTANSITAFPSVLQRINQSGNNISASFDYGTSGAGMKSIHRTSATDVICYNDTTSSAGLTATSTGVSNLSQVVLRSASSYSNHQVSMYAMGAAMISENSSFVSAFSTYLNSL